MQNLKGRGQKSKVKGKETIRDTVEILYKVTGEGTRILSEKKEGEELNLIGPLGNGYQIPDTRYQIPVILVAGGVGIASLLFLAEKIKSQVTSSQLPVTVFIGAKTKDQVLCEGDFKNLGCEVKISTEDGSYGHRGLVTEFLKTFLSAFRILPEGALSHRDGPHSAFIYACGPKPMLKEVAGIAGKDNIPCQVSLEEHMACGLGACLGCAIKTVTSYQLPVTNFTYKRVCKDGPVFDASEVIWG
jgi:dihydroorotate dehydrogenase electron transfer subunit